MKNFKKVAIGIFVAVIAFSFSAFTNAKKFATTNKFYNTTGIASSNPADYVYRGGGVDRCLSNPSDVCTAEWSTTNTPTTGQTPTQAGSPSFVGNPTSGDYNP
ncbi:hypothetical protein DIU31_006185 [Mucilaginibacter rubeus]|uniref:Uncharacterized protein n=1 Tax=Mucilaginibacter rubeus TaxID=2027860 RepID=A0AAE6JCP3_9SPHI|nr:MULTISPECIES: hypothetical protein [Mucilaginibacter]QEM03130.1 hypothetical protein DIU31_006185 [Mucilaginibacter rubeus]QEM15748.1 hypothetical protein DIU38_006255 [Mucilaginibacter gossypii]QTE41511.1 hypothetical protein J3L19_21520 [Mucilaginibacter rubeus]QTE48117.1 hypothetical protein J3L21_21520 [Mucilaginibacter rubeus]QTE59508.1 hypothetical protein J3L23_13165 [Mucilaginibacter rubeus]